jgi:AraC-like DNA-binding protein
VKSLRDYETAKILNVNSALTGRLRKEFGIKRVDGFSMRFRHTYGKDALAEFQEIIEMPDTSLSDVARHFGFSRQYASEVYKKIYGRCYAEARRRKRMAREREAKNMGKMPKTLRDISEIRNKVESLGLAARIVKKKYGYFLTTNGFKLAFRQTSTHRSVGHREYFHVTNLKGAADFDYDFLIVLCICGEDSTYFVIPRDVVPKHGVSLIPRAGLDESKYSRFKEAWHLLGPKHL